MFTPAMALSKAIGREVAGSVMYRPLPQREGFTAEVHSVRRQSTRRVTEQFQQSAQRTGDEIRIHTVYVNPTMRDALVKAMSDK